MQPFPPLDGKEYNLVAVDDVSKWVETINTTKNNHREVLRYRYLRTIINDGGSHFNNVHFGVLLKN